MMRSLRNEASSEKLGKGIAVLVTLVMLVSNFAGALPGDTQTASELLSVPEDYEAVIAAVNASQTGEIDPLLDLDGDGISDYDEITGFNWMNRTYFTNPYMASTDRDPYDDYMEITGINMPTAVRSPGRHPGVPSSPVLGIDLVGIDVTALTTISATQTKEKGSSWTMVTETGWSINPEVSIEGGPKFGNESEIGITASGKISGEYHSKTTETTSKWSREEWSSATAVDSGKAAKLKFHVKIRNTGTDSAKNVKLRFNVMLGNGSIVDTIWTDVVEWSITPGEVSEEMVISKDQEGNDIVVSLDELKSIESGTPITITVTEINAEVPWEGGWITWNDYKGEIEPVSSEIMVDFGGGDAREYNAWAGLHLLAEPPHPTIHDITLWAAIDRTLGIEDKEDGIYIGGKRMEKGWEFIFDNETANSVAQKLDGLGPDWNLYDLLNLVIEPRWTLLIKAPDSEPPKIHWASYSADRKMILASVSDNVQVKNVTAHVKVNDNYEDIVLKDDDGDSIFIATSSEAITDTYDDYVIADDGTFVSIWNDIRLAELRYWWPMFHHDARHTGYSTSSAPNDNHVLWNLTIGEYVVSSPAVVNGKVFVIAVTNINPYYSQMGSRDYKILCLDETNGTIRWQRPILGQPMHIKTQRMYSSPTVVDGKVFFGTDDQKLYCYAEENGIKIKDYFIPWISDPLYVRGGITLTPVTVVEDKVFFQAFQEDVNIFGVHHDRSHIFCLDESDLTMNWESYPGSWKSSDTIEKIKFQSSPAVANGKVFFGTWNTNTINCYDTNKNVVWPAFSTKGGVVSSPAVVDGMVFVGSCDKKIYCLDEISGYEKWNFSTGDWVTSTPAVANGKVYVGSTDNKVYCLDEYTGNESWNFTTGDAVHSSPAVADGKVYVGSTDNKVYCLDEYTGNESWNFTTGGAVYSSPAVANGKVFVGSNDGNIYCFGPPLLKPPTASIIAISPATVVQGEDNITFEGEGTDDNGYVEDYLWASNIDGNISTSDSFTMPASNLSVGTHSIFFKVKDNDGLWSTQDVGYVTVKAPNSPPVVAFNASPENPIIDEAVTFNASHSYDPDGFIKRYTWNFGDGTTATGKVVTHAYSEAGDYTVTLNVTDYYGLTNEITITFTIFPFSLVIVSPENKTYASTSVPLNYLVEPSSVAPNWTWYILDDGEPVNVTGNTTVSGLNAGNHTIVVYANDTLGNTVASNTVLFTIHPADIDFNGRVYVSDNLLLAQAYGSRPGDANWNPAADFTCDDRVYVADNLILSQNYGMVY